LAARGDGFGATAFSSDVAVTNNLVLSSDPKMKLLRTLVRELNLPACDFDFTPKKVRGSDGKPVTLDYYYENAYVHLARDGVLCGAGVSFSKAVERSDRFEPMIEEIFKNGGRVSFDVAASDYFLVVAETELKGKSDGRVRAYRRSRRQQVVTLDEFFEEFQ
jgi:hypothetical protein